MSDTERIVREALAEAQGEAEWVARYSGYGKSLSALVERAWRREFPERRNRPTHRNIEAALARLVAAGEVERKVEFSDSYYRLIAPIEEA